ncbi:MAG TPA: hypothetical protein PLQ11_07010, partial [Beijerinckiaceae bacterium]|nr:hypothetical protein [Beijerinckiaceae bacterium]
RKVEASGAVRLLGARIGGDLACDGGRFLRKGEDALNCDGMSVTGALFLREVEASGEVRLLGARIGGNLVCDGGRFLKKGEDALSCDRMNVAGDLFLRKVEASGAVRLLGARIGGNLSCNGGRFLNEDGRALTGDKMSVTGTLFLREGTTIAGTLDLASAEVGGLVDDPACWPSEGKLILDGFRYARFGGATPATDRRGDWLMRQRRDHLGSSFRPQPWKQAIRVLREMGHDTEARALAIRFEQQRRKAGVFRGMAGVLHDLYGAMAGYGHRPMLLMRWMAAVWLTCALFYQNASDFGVMAPTNPLVFDNPAYTDCRPRAGSLTNWTNSGTCNGPNEYTTFQPLLYSLDLILPLVDLQQDKDWAPMVTRARTSDPKGETEDFPLGHFIRVVMWFEILFGWVASLMFVAILSGLIKKGDEE